MKKWVVYLLIFPFCNLVLAQEKKNWVLRNLGKLGAFIDTMTVRGIDPSYIEVPQKPWQLILRYNTNDMHMTSRTKIDQEQLAARGLEGELNWETTIKPMATTSVGAWIGYRGYGLGYSYSFNKQQGQDFAFSATGSNYSVSIHLRRFKTSEMGVHVWGYDEDGTVDETFDGESFDPLTIHTTMVNGFYMLNSKRFSHAAAYDQSVIQRRSAGSLVLGAAWFYQSLDYVSNLNAMLIQYVDNIGRIQVYEGSLTVGYAYNWVPVKNLLVNVTALPMITFFNQAKTHLYESNYDVFLEPGTPSPDGKKPFPEDEYDYSWMDDITVYKTDTKTKHGNVSINFDARASVTYQLGNYFLNVYGQLSHYRHHLDDNKLRNSEWSVNASIGIRL